jgi:hypothetical protein
VPKAFSGQDDAVKLAIHALSFLAADPERLGPFLALTGIDPGRIRESARSPGFLNAVLEHVCSDQELLLDFASEAGRRPEDIDRARQILAGPVPNGLRDG